MPAHPRRTSLLALSLSAVTGAALCLPSTASAGEAEPSECSAPVPSTTQEGYLVADPDCDPNGTPFTALPGATAYTGIEDGQAYRIEVPDDWNGDLVVYAHGYRGTGTTVHVDSPALRRHFLDRGYAWAASSYQVNNYAVDQGVEDSHDMIERFRSVVPAGADLDEVVIHGVSMGGHITAVETERYPDAWSAAYPVCGVLGDVALYDYFLDTTVTAAALAGTEIGFSEYGTPTGAGEYEAVVGEQILPALFTQRPTLSETGQQWAAAVQQLSGGARPGFAGSLAYWNSFGFPPLVDLPFLFGLYPGLSATSTGGVSTGNFAGNADRVYQLDADPALSAAENALNAAVLRVTPDEGVTGIPVVEATSQVPVLSLHTLGDLFVPFSMEQIYAAEAEANSTPFVSRGIRANGHCEFEVGELAKGFDDLILWTRTGRAPAGDPVLDAEAVAEPAFGCRFTQASRPGFVAEACPTFPDIEGSAHATAIRSQLAAGVVQGLADGTFGPLQPVTRGQAASLVARAAGLQASPGGPDFSDIEGSAHEAAIRALAEAGVVTGYSDGTYRPGLPTARAQIVSLLARTLDVSSTQEDCFSDVSGVHAASVCALAELGIAEGMEDGTFQPAQPVNRAQATSFVDRTFG